MRWHITFPPFVGREPIGPVELDETVQLLRDIRDHVRTTLGRDDLAVALGDVGSPSGSIIGDGWRYLGAFYAVPVEPEPERPYAGVRVSGGGATT